MTNTGKSPIAAIGSNSILDDQVSSFDTSTPNGRRVFGTFASIAEFERELIRDRVKSGLRAARLVMVPRPKT